MEVKPAFNAVQQVVGKVFSAGAWRATKYLSPTMIVRATLQGRKVDKRARGFQIVLTIGKPNYREREVIATLKKAGEPFPVKNIFLQFPPQPKKKNAKKN